MSVQSGLIGLAAVLLCAGPALAQIETGTPTLPGGGRTPPASPSTGTSNTSKPEAPKAPPLGQEIDLSRLETKDLRLLYFDPTETYLTPYLARSFENSLAFQEKTFGWKP